MDFALSPFAKCVTVCQVCREGSVLVTHPDGREGKRWVGSVRWRFGVRIRTNVKAGNGRFDRNGLRWDLVAKKGPLILALSPEYRGEERN